MSRQKSTHTDTRAGCFECGGTDPLWTASNAMAVAARHHDATGHETWADQILTVRYGERSTSHPDMFAQLESQP